MEPTEVKTLSDWKGVSMTTNKKETITADREGDDMIFKCERCGNIEIVKGYEDKSNTPKDFEFSGTFNHMHYACNNCGNSFDRHLPASAI